MSDPTANVGEAMMATITGGRRLESAAEMTPEYRENLIYDQTNSMYSLWLARDLLTDGFVVLNADVLFHPQLLSNLLNATPEDALLIAYRDATTPPFGDEEMKVKVRDGLVVDISKEMAPAEADGENVGMVKFGPSGARLLVRHMDELVAQGLRRAWAPRAFAAFAAERPLYAIGTGDYPWIEIDFPEDYRRAVDEVLPQLLRAGGSGGSAPALAAVTEAAHG